MSTRSPPEPPLTALAVGDAQWLPRWARVTIVVGVVAGIATLLALIYAFDPSAPTSRFPPCFFHMLTGLDCPGCGTTRGLHALLHGDVVTAWNFNALMFFALPTVALLGAWEAARFVGIPLPALRAPRHTAWAIFFVVVAFGVLRNVL